MDGWWTDVWTDGAQRDVFAAEASAWRKAPLFRPLLASHAEDKLVQSTKARPQSGPHTETRGRKRLDE